MSKIKRITPSSIDTIQNAIDKKLAEIEKEFGVSIKFNGGKYTDSYFRKKMEIAVVSENGKVKSKKAIAFKRQVKNGNISDEYEVGGRVRTSTGDTFIIDGYNSRARKYPVELHNRDRRVKMSKSMLEMCEVINYEKN